MTTVQ